jgi:hypothetical protein
MKLGDNGLLNTRNKFPKEFFFPIPKISLSILDELEELRFGEICRSLRYSWGWSHGFSPRMEVDDEAHPSTQLHRRNQRKTPPNSRMKNRAKIL